MLAALCRLRCRVPSLVNSSCNYVTRGFVDGCVLFVAGGWVTHDGTLFIPAPEGYFRDKQAMVLGMDYYTSAVMIQAALDTVCLDIVEALIGPDIELYGKGQILYKEPAGGFAKQMHQDAAYFDFAMDGPVGTLNYAIDTSRELGNGPLYVVPGSHKRGYMQHEDTDSHLALPEREYAFDEAICVDGEAGDTVFFHVHCVHGSTPNFSSSPRATFINRCEALSARCNGAAFSHCCVPQTFTQTTGSCCTRRAHRCARKGSAVAPKCRSKNGTLLSEGAESGVVSNGTCMFSIISESCDANYR